MKFRPTARCATRASPAFGSPTSTCWYFSTSGPPNCSNRIAQTMRGSLAVRICARSFGIYHSMAEHLVVVGGGQAASQAVQTLRQHNYAGAITLFGDEQHAPYQRPPLSKKYLAGELP